jgi:phthalate 4,5-dioxygenase oxygenase subunit
MLSPEDMELLCRVGVGTPMGELIRRYWLPAMYSWEIPPDGQPLRVRLLGEDLIAWRSTDGTASFVQDRCPHRGAGFYFGRNEESGLRCAYHGWKFDVAGNCVDMPNEPAGSNFKNKVRITAYRGADFGGVTWVYMGQDQDAAPDVPQFEWGLVPEDQLRHSHKIVYDCNWMQSLEGELDTTHVYFLHSRLNPEDPTGYGVYLEEKGADFHIVGTNVGLTYGAARREPDGSDYWRMTNFLFPFYGMFPGAEDGTTPLSIYVPIDDYHTLHLGLRWHPSRALPKVANHPTSNAISAETGMLSPGTGPMKPEQKGKFFSHWWPEASLDNDFMMDLEAKKTRNFTGIPSVRLQDAAVIWSMGPIMDRTKEHLGTSDATIIKVRRMLIGAALALRDHGTVPPGADDPQLYTVRSVATVLPRDADWEEALADWHYARTTEHPGAAAQRAIKERG